MFECITKRCKWTVLASRIDKADGMFEITIYTGLHSCGLIEAYSFGLVYATDEIECLVREHPTISIAELKNWWKENLGMSSNLRRCRRQNGKAIMKIVGDLDESTKKYLQLRCVKKYNKSTGCAAGSYYITMSISVVHFKLFRLE